MLYYFRWYLQFWGPSKLFFSRPWWHQSECGLGYQKHWMKIWEGTSGCALSWLVLPCYQCTSELISFCLHGPCWLLHLPGHGQAMEKSQFNVFCLMYTLATIISLDTKKPITIKQIVLIQVFSDGWEKKKRMGQLFSFIIYISKMINCFCSEGELWNVFVQLIVNSQLKRVADIFIL